MLQPYFHDWVVKCFSLCVSISLSVCFSSPTIDPGSERVPFYHLFPDLYSHTVLAIVPLGDADISRVTVSAHHVTLAIRVGSTPNTHVWPLYAFHATTVFSFSHVMDNTGQDSLHANPYLAALLHPFSTQRCTDSSAVRPARGLRLLSSCLAKWERLKWIKRKTRNSVCVCCSGTQL